MIYQVEIGDHANAYIITSGLTGLSTFEPTIIIGDDTGVRINVDSKDDNIFTPWIKQSLEFTIVKETDTQYDDILAGNDNETFGILIENGSLYLDGSDITITNGGILKFIGTLALESYVEQYKQTSIVQFTFHDRIGTLEDDLFYTNSKFKSVADILACCINKISCSDNLKLEWPYTLSTSNDPAEILLDIENYDGKKRIELLEDVLHDFGLQLIVDFEANATGLVTTAGAVLIRSVVDHVAQYNTYWELALTSYVSSTCGREYFTYTGSIGSSEFKARQLLNTMTYPLIDADASLSLERVGSAIEAKNTLDITNDAIFRGKFDFKYAYLDVDKYRYCPMAYLPETNASAVAAIKDLLDFTTTIGDYNNPECFVNGYEVLVLYNDVFTSFDHFPTVHSPIYLNKDQFNSSDELEFKISFTAYNPYIINLYPEFEFILMINPVIWLKATDTYKVYYNDTWNTLTSLDPQLVTYNQFSVPSLSTLSDKLVFTIDSDGDDVVLMFVLTSIFDTSVLMGSGFYGLQVSNLELAPIEDTGKIPNSINLTTDLTGNNRKVVTLDSKFMNVPNIVGACYSLPNLIKDIANKYPITLDYKTLSQTLLAHLSDQYGWQYDGNRWNLDGSAKVKDYENNLNLSGQFALDEKILIFLNGDYDAKRKTIKGKWGQVLEVGTEIYQLEKDNFDHFTWDNGAYIMLN